MLNAVKNLSRTFIEVPHFTKKWFELGFSDDDLALLENRLLHNSDSGDIMEGTGGVRKLESLVKEKVKAVEQECAM